ncbi:hypothetical protein JCM9140_1165 [Halalkalibacter wakoensis JCM 9140]|uniref:Uncharacterized protein n=1 Tax=Halalkalibacter wakoensis JCM 9140 TaxID=1236970 RepID=W4PZB9_9BACI|nr:hypothetical protein [Halalkalibacter wakoensis]GAE25186.1 hypothetical protein JCM9140_1165 [Halalkalibacter wakoensis JCM 9140]
MLNKNEEFLASQYIHLPLVRKVLERDLLYLRKANLKFNEPYIQFVEQIITEIGKDLGAVKKEMFQNGLTVYEQGKSGEVYTYLIVCRGYRSEMRFFPHLLKQSVEEYINKYFSGMKKNA